MPDLILPRHVFKDREASRMADEVEEAAAKEDMIGMLAPLIGNQAMLDKVLDGVKGGPEMRAAVLEKIRPHLKFVPDGTCIECQERPVAASGTLCRECEAGEVERAN